jgi:RimJ/RimL family protein N-acetyltransferase
MGSRVRAVTVEDADAIGRIHVRGWQVAYRGLVPQWYLDGLDVDARTEMWRQNLARPGDVSALLIEDDTGAVAGVATIGPERGGGGPAVGELWMIYLDPEAWGRGFGRAPRGEVPRMLGVPRA